MATYEIISPVDSLSVVQRVKLDTVEQALGKVEVAKQAQRDWKLTSLEERKRILTAFVDALISDREEIATELSHLIGRPRKQNFNEVNGFESRARHLISVAEEVNGIEAHFIRNRR